MINKKLHLFSFSTCPYLQAIVINLKEKQKDFNVTYVDLEKNTSLILNKIPLGRLPAVKIGDDLLFESSAINEYIEDTSSVKLRPSDPIQLAKSRAWIVFIQDTLLALYKMIVAAKKEDYNKYTTNLLQQLIIIDKSSVTPFFNGQDLSIVDIELAPLLYRIQIINEFGGLDLLEATTKLQNLSDNILNKPTVRESVPVIFKESFLKKIVDLKGYINTILTEISY